MKHILLALLLATLCATASSQTIKSLGYNTTNGKVVFSGTNTLNFTNAIALANGAAIFFTNTSEFQTPIWFGDRSAGINVFEFEIPGDAAIARTNLGLGATNNVSFSDIQINEFGEDPVFVKNESGFFQFVVNTNIAFSFSDSIGVFNFPVEFNNATNAAITRTNLGLPWTGLTNTNAATFQGAFFSATNAAPSNTNAPTPDAWVDIQVGTNTYKLPLWQ